MSALRRLGLGDHVGWVTTTASAAQQQTAQAFAFKWGKRDTYDSATVRESTRRWLIERYCGGDESLVDRWLAGERRIIVDAGCGAAVSAMLLFGDRLREHDYLGLDISDAIHVARARFDEAGYPGDFVQADLTEFAIPESTVDLIFSEGVLHHTDSTEAAFKHLATKLKPGGRFLLYVYARKGPIREFTDDLVRAHLQSQSDSAAWSALLPLTKLGVALGDLDAEVDVPEAIPFLGIPAGRINIQRLFYWYVCKLYYRPGWTLEELNHVNFDWYRPLNCHRHTPDEVGTWCADAGLVIERMDVQESGITVVALRTDGPLQAGS